MKKKKHSHEHKSYTAWHVFLAEVMDYFFDPAELEVYPFVKLGTLPLESDFIILRKKGSIAELLHLYPDFDFLLPYLGEISVIEYKSPLDTLNHIDFDTLRIYQLMAKRKYNLNEDHRIAAISMASKFENGYADYLKGNGYRFEEIKKGIYAHLADHRSYYWINLRVIGQSDPENFINLFSSNYKQYGQADKPNIRRIDALNYILQAIFRRKLDMMNNIEIRQLPEFTTLVEEMLKRFLESLTPEERLAGLKPEEVVTRFKLEERLVGLKPEEVVTRFKPEERLVGLKPEERLAGLSKAELENLKKLLNNLS